MFCLTLKKKKNVPLKCSLEVLKAIPAKKKLLARSYAIQFRKVPTGQTV